MKEKSNFRKGLERILASGIIFVGGLVGSANAEKIKIMNTTSNLSVGVSNIYSKNVSDANEFWDSLDGYWSGVPPSPYPNRLHIYTAPYTEELETDARPQESITPFEVHLAVKGYVDYADNSLKFKVMDGSGLEHRKIIAYNSADPNTIYEINKQVGFITEIPLLPLQNKSEGDYAVWTVKCPKIIEGDINENGICDMNDLEVLASEWLVSSNPNGIPVGSGNYLSSDLNLDGETNFLDFAILAKDYGKSE